ncbi:ExeA family protein [Thiobacillus sedimenti]|uniref:AAA family ATPase n=1 Tax=Thiobacillus sedimenti TaxID=3110231 RepID=A0ABZ1CKF5_9PROT|nr:AAA family ATPase [Thiobacillus sp. SCUT-2]WRS39869.1 AAA family ATPase [Thiobacillus sp. SCUT-2]
MYLDHFGLKEAPFRITPNTEYWYPGGQRGEMLAALVYAIGQGEGIIKVVGEVGSGKTMLCRKLAAQLPATVDSVYLGNPTLSPDDMLAAILADLGVDAPETGRQARLAQLNATLLARHEAGRRVVVFVEEAQGIALDNLEFLRLLTNLETATDKLLQIVLFGQPELDAHLADPRIRQLKDRVTLSLDLSPLTQDEVAEYLRARLSVAGYRGPDLFPPALIARMTRLSGGLSRRINVLADKTLLAAYAAQTHTLTPAHLDAAAGDADIRTAERAAGGRQLPRWAALAAGVATGLGLLAFVAWQAHSLASPATPARAADAPRPPLADPAARVTELARQTERWLATAAPGTRVIQIASAKEAAEAAVLLGGLDAATPRPVRVLHGLSQGAPAWMILAGEFPSRDAALAALHALPPAPAGTPFLRTVGKMRAVVLPLG